MDIWTLQRPSWLRFLRLLPLFLFSLAVSLVCLYIGIGFVFGFVLDTGFDLLHFLVGLFILLFAALFALICFWILRGSFSQVFFSSKSIEQRIFGKTRGLIPWDELAEVGIALDRWTVRGGPHRCLFFADRHLDQLERAAIDEAFDRAKSGRMIRVSCKDLQNTAMLKKYCPVPIPTMRETKSGEHILLSYRRSRNSQGSWGAAQADILSDADSVVSHFRESQRRSNR